VLQRLLTDLPEVAVVALVGEQAGRRERERTGRGGSHDHLFHSEMVSHTGRPIRHPANSGHFLTRQEPGLVAEETIRMVSTVRQSSANR